MKRKLLLALGGTLLLGASVFFIWKLYNRKVQPIPYNPAYDAYLAAFTNGDISKNSTILVRFAMDVSSDTGHVIQDSPFSFSPGLQGEAHWLDTRTIEFKPDKPLSPGEIYTATLDLGNIVKDIPSDLRYFKFQFRGIPRKINVSPISTTSWIGNDGKWCSLNGYITTSDVEDKEYVQKLLAAYTTSGNLKVRWSHSDNGLRHNFTIDSLKRQDAEYNVVLDWKKDKSENNETKVAIPSVNDFSVMSASKYDSDGERYLLITFTDPIDRNQNLEGLIRADNNISFRFNVEGNIVKAYPAKQYTGKFNLSIERGILNTMGQALNKPFNKNLTFDQEKPALKLVGKGVIIPKSETLPFIFEAVCLKAVDVRIIKIVESNLPQFFQVNNLNGQRELRRVGKVVLQKRIDLDKNKDLDLKSWNYHSIDLSSLINPEPGAIYEVAIGFRKSYTLWENCPPEVAETETDEEGNVLPPGETPEENKMLEIDLDDWGSSNDEYYYYDYYDDYYEEGGDPCDHWYYGRDRAIRRNVLSSDFGLIAKTGSGGSFFAVTNLQTAQPMPGIDLEVLDYQNQLVAKFKTDKDGQVFTKLERRGHLLVAKSGNMRGYLRLDDGSALAMSRFDVAGALYHKGLKGFIYGERGVWRPGDEMFLNFVLEDPDNTLPPNHPVTFELVGPRGQVVQRIVKNEGLNGFYNFTCKTAPDAFTGNYQARVRVGGATFEKTLKVETVMPNRLKINLDFGQEAIYPSMKGKNADLAVKWLHGAPAKALKADVKVNLFPGKTTFKKFPNFSFDDPTRTFYSDEITLFEGQLDDNGNAKVLNKLDINGTPPGVLMANFRVRAFEPGGNFSTDRFTIPLYSYPYYVGMQTAKGQEYEWVKPNVDNKVRVATVDVTGNPVSRKNVTISVYKLDWHWWFDRADDEEYSYRRAMEKQAVFTSTLETNEKGEAEWSYQLKEWGRFLVRVTDEGGHASGKIVYVDWPYWDEVAGADNSGGPAFLGFSADKEKYTAGENITINIPTPNGGKALVTVETGTKVLSAKWVDTKSGVTNYSFPATKEMSPNAYVTVALLQPHQQTANDLPMRMFGVVPILVEDPNSRLEPTITMADKLEPAKEFSVKVGEKRGGPMTYTIAVVDEGLLGLTRYKTPNPWDYFFQREALGVKTWDLYDWVLDAFKGEVKSLLSIGGDAVLANSDKPDRFKPVVLYMGPFELKKGEVRNHTFKMPNYFGEVRVMVVAGQGSAYGSAEKSVPVKQPLMALATLPRVLGPGETVALPVTVFAMDPNLGEVTLKVETDGLVDVGEGGIYRKLRFKEEGEDITSFNLKVQNKIGKGHVKVTATGGGHSAVYETDIDVRVPNPRITDVASANLEAGKDWSTKYKPMGMDGTNKGVLEVSSVPPMNLGKRLEYLIRYPYGCVEQTTSAAFPQLYVGRLMDLNDAKKAEVEKNVKAAIERLASFQTAAGGFAYWPGQSDYNEWATSYVGHFLAEAKKAGYTVSDDMMKKWAAFSRNKANEWTESQGVIRNDLQQAYRLFALAMNGTPEMGAMNRLKSANGGSVASRWLLAAAYHMAGQKDVAKKIVEKAERKVAEYQEWSYTYGSKVRDESMILMTLSLMGRREESLEVAKYISERLSSNNWMSTQETCMALMAMCTYIGDDKSGNKLNFSYRFGTGSWIDVTSSKPLVQIFLPSPDAANTIEFKNKSGAMCFPRLVSEGIPMEGDGSNASNGVKMTVEYQSTEGKKLDPARLEQGTDFVAIVSLENTSNSYYQELALNQIFPSGWEIHNGRMDGNEAGGDVPTYQDIRDDRVYSFYNMPGKSKKTFKVLLHAAYLGHYYLPTAYTEAMYDHTINARVGGKWVDVVAKTND